MTVHKPKVRVQHRFIHEIAAEVVADHKANGKEIYFGMVPYLAAMHSLGSVEESYYEDPASEVLNYFLSNASYWRGETARRIKAEIKEMI